MKRHRNGTPLPTHTHHTYTPHTTPPLYATLLHAHYTPLHYTPTPHYTAWQRQAKANNHGGTL
jgi:hypothetical protein